MMTEFWEKNFAEKQEMWGLEPAQSAIVVKNLFLKEGINNILIPGIGYGRNAAVFISSNISVTGIEISSTAISLAEKHFGNKIKIHHGSITQMPFDNLEYKGIYCHALIHLLSKQERAKLIADCWQQLSSGGCMIFTVIAKTAATYKQGNEIEKDQFEQFGGVKMFFFDNESIAAEFGNYGLSGVENITENYPFHAIKCIKP